MLSLRRREGESIIIGNHISVTVCSVRGNRVRLAIEGPSHVSICRSELLSAFSWSLTADDQVDVSEDRQPSLVASDG